MAIAIEIQPVNSDGEASQLQLDQSLITFGRSKSCHVELNKAEVSRRHFIIKYVDDAYLLFDEGSRHGTQLDGQILEALKAYPLQKKHCIEVPGFRITVVNDGQKPKLERTTVVARKLLDELLQGEVAPRNSPCLKSPSGNYLFRFNDEKTTFVLGSAAQNEFQIPHESVREKHLSFVRDISGIRVIPLPQCDVTIDTHPLTEPQLLQPGARIRVGTVTLIFCENNADDITESTPPAPDEALVSSREAQSASSERDATKEAPCIPEPKKSFFVALDRVFLVSFIVVIAGVSIVLYRLF